MSNQDLYRTWVERYAQRIKQPPQHPSSNQPAAPSVPTSGAPPITLPIGSNSRFLDNAWGKDIHDKVMRRWGTYEVIKKVTYVGGNENIVKGSNPFYVVAVNTVLQDAGGRLQVATQADLETILKNNSLTLKDRYEDTGLVWRSSGDPNKYFAKDLANQCKARGQTLVEGMPYVFPLVNLKLRDDSKSPTKLSFIVGALGSYYQTPVLKSADGSYIHPAEVDSVTGLPTKVYPSAVAGNRQLWTRDSGLSGLYLDGDLDVNSNSGGLADSSDVGRVVLVSGAAATQKNSGGTP